MASKHWIRASAVIVMLFVACAQSARDDGAERVSVAAQAASVPPGFVDEVVTSGIVAPTAMTFTPDGRLLVAQQGGQLRVVRDGVLLSQPFATLPVTSGGERGLLGVAVDPAFATNAYVYVYYTVSSPRVHNRITRLRAAGDVAEADSEQVLMELDDVGSCTIHMGGALHFGPDGHLYAAVGESCVPALAQRLDSLAGKLLRLAADGTIPSDNPFYASTRGNHRAIWALGLRNPFSFAFSRSGRMFINDVGDADWEEVNEGRAGANYGWPESEGPTSAPGHTSPVYAYPHSGSWPNGCSITGAAFYDPPVAQYPAQYLGKFFYGDFCQGYVRSLDPASYASEPFIDYASRPVALAVSPDGFLYRLEYDSGSLVRVRYAAEEPPAIQVQPADRAVAVGQAVTFRVSASGSQPLRYQWLRDGVDIPDATADTLTLTAAASDDGAAFQVRVSNAFGSVTSDAAILDVTQGTAPVADILGPEEGALFSAGDTIAYAATASDAEDGALPASAFTWEVVLHHDQHTHPFVPPYSGSTSGTFEIPRVGHTETNVFYRIHLRVTDSSGLVTAAFRDVSPRLTTLTLETRPPGLTVTFDGTPVTTPASMLSVVGITHVLGVVDPQTVAGATYAFRSWSDGEAATHAIDAPAVDTTYTASFAQTACPAPPPAVEAD